MNTKHFEANSRELAKPQFERWIMRQPVGTRIEVTGVYAATMIVRRIRGGWQES